jgi:hypothetical protein
MRRSLTLLATVAILMGLVAAPAVAEKPVEFSFDVSWVDVDPCTGDPMDIDVHLEIREHQTHNNNLTGLAKATGTTSSGYVLSGSPEHLMIRDSGAFVVSVFSDRWKNPDTGAKMHAQGVFVLKDGVPHVDKFRIWCVGGPTLP